ncbi:MAG: YHYH protein [Planctomycetota bacterium]
MNQVTIEERDGYRYIVANGIPDHAHGDFPNRGNPNSILAQRFAFRVPLEPEWRDEPVPLGHHPFGVALNGVPFDPGTAEFWNGDRRSGWNYEALSGRINLGLDHNHAHVQPSGAYHYHGTPQGLIQALLQRSRQPSTRNSRGKTPMVLLGYAADGYPIYNAVGHAEPENQRSRRKFLRSSYRLKRGTRPSGPRGKYDGTFTEDYEFATGLGDLDECNGYYGVTPESTGATYYYCITESFPHIPRFYHGVPDESFLRRHGRGPNSRPRAP